MLEILGKDYIIEHCVVFLKKRSEEKLFREYVADALMVISHNTALHGGKEMVLKFSEVLNPPKKEEEKTEEEIINHVRNKLRGK